MTSTLPRVILKKNSDCSLVLQMALYFNAYFFIFWFLFHISSIHLKLSSELDMGKFIQITTLSILLVIELPRIYLGYVGNLKAQITSALGFWLLTLLIQIPILLLLIFAPFVYLTSLEVIMYCSLLIFFLIEISFGYLLIHSLIKKVI